MRNMNQSFGEAYQPPIAGKLMPATMSDAMDIKKLLQEAADFKWQRGDDLWELRHLVTKK